MPVSKIEATIEPKSAEKTVAELVVDCLKNELVQYFFGLPGEENIHLVEALTSPTWGN
jgi:hypothetical protein